MKTILTKNSHPIIAGILYTIVLLLFFTVLVALTLYFNLLSEANIFIISVIITALSIIIGGFVSGKRAGRKGWLYGGFVGTLYGIILLIITFLAFDTNIDIQHIVFVIFTFLIGAFGGIFGVNMKK